MGRRPIGTGSPFRAEIHRSTAPEPSQPGRMIFRLLESTSSIVSRYSRVFVPTGLSRNARERKVRLFDSPRARCTSDTE